LIGGKAEEASRSAIPLQPAGTLRAEDAQHGLRPRLFLLGCKEEANGFVFVLVQPAATGSRTRQRALRRGEPCSAAKR
jgi:hypothetical protein